MNPKNTWLLVFLTAALFAFIFFFERHLQPPKPEVVRVLPQLKIADISDVEIHLAGQTEFRAERTNGGWLLTAPPAFTYPAQTSAVEGLLAAAADLTPRTYLSAQELKGRLTVNEEYGFDNPQATIVFQQGGDRRQLTLKLGFFTAPGDNIYAQVVGSDGVDIIDADFFKKIVPHHVNQWRDTVFVPLKGVDFDRLTVAPGAPATPFELRRDGTNGVWQMKAPVVTRADYPKINHLLNVLQNLQVNRFVSDNAKADLEPYGLQPASLELKFDRGTNHLLALQFGKSPTNDEAHLYARISGQNAIVLIPREAIAPWLGGYEEFRDHHLIRLTSLPEVIQMFGAENGAENFTVQRQANDTWRVMQPMEFAADTNAMHNFLVTLAGLEVVHVNNAVAVTDAALPDSDFPLYGLAKPARRYVLKSSADETPAAASNAVQAELDFGSVKDGKVFVRRADRPEETSVYAVKLEDFQKLPANSLQLRERRIWNFSENDVSRIIIHQNGKAQELVHKGPNHWSIAAGSQGLINDLQIEVGAQELGFLAAENWIERGDADRAHYGFTAQSMQISVEVKTNGQPQTLSVDLGGVSPRGLRYGDVRMADGQNWIFEFSPVAMDRLTSYFDIKEAASP